MTYENILQTIRNILDNELIEKKGLTLTYELDVTKHKQLDEELYIQMHGHINDYEPSDVFEIELGGILIKFIKKDLDG